MKLYIVRHAEKIRAPGDVHISEEGKNQALLTGKYFSSKNIDIILSSPKKRTIETANVINKFIRADIKLSMLLDERIDFGDIPNQSYQDYFKLCVKSTLNRSYVLPNGQSSIKAGKRFESAIKQFYNTESIIIVISHTGVIADFLRNNFSDNLLKQKSMYFSKYYAVEYCSITEIKINRNKKELIKLGSIKHLDL